jgi:hypothetical protein
MKTTKERQADYRKKRPTSGENGERRINTWVATGASLALKRLAEHYGVTKREMLERLILSADQQIINSLDLDSEEWAQYCNVTA